MTPENLTAQQPICSIRARDSLSYDGSMPAAALSFTIAVIAAGLAFGGELGYFALTSLEVLPVSLLAVFAYLGTERRWARALTLVLLAVILLVAGHDAVQNTLLVLVPEARAHSSPGLGLMISSLNIPQFALACGGIGLALLLATSAFLPRVRHLLARLLPLDPDSFVHTVALVTVVGLTLIYFVPLLILSNPTDLSLTQIQVAQGEDLTAGRSYGGQLRSELYGLMWLVPATLFAVGYGVRRDFKAALERIGLQRPTWRQVLGGAGLAAVLVIVVIWVLLPSIDWVWGAMGWPLTDEEALGKLRAHMFTPLGAVVIGVVAGLGEELAVRGVLQPRLGLFLSNLFFTVLHASIYNWDALVSVFVLGLVFGVIRKKTNTTTSAIVHGMYDFLLLMTVALQIPGLSG